MNDRLIQRRRLLSTRRVETREDRPTTGAEAPWLAAGSSPLRVTRADIDAARAANWYCPITRAVCRQLGILPEEEFVGTCRDSIGFGPPDGIDDEISIGLPPGASAFTLAFDRGQPVAPFAFELPVDEIPKP